MGYEKISLNPGFNMVGVQFAKVGGDNLLVATVGSLDDKMAGFDEDEIFATEMRIWDGNGYDTYGWSGTSGTDVYDDSSYDNQWLDSITMEAIDTTAAAGSGFWIKAEKAGTMTISGEVPTEPSVTIQLKPGFNMVANPYPGEVTISEFGTLSENMAGFDEDEIFATEMRVWDGNGYDTYGWSGTSGTDVYDDASYDNLWLDSITMEASDKTIPFGTAVWIKTDTTGSITFKNPTSN